MKRFIHLGLFVLLLSCFATHAWSETKYIRTIVKITLRTGPGTDHKILRMIESGQEVDVIEAADKWARVRVAGGKTGWVLTNLLTSDQPQTCISEDGTPSTGREIDAARQKELAGKNKTLLAENQKLTGDLAESQSVLEALNASFESYRKESEGYEDLKSEHERTAALLTEQTEKADQLAGIVADYQFQQNIWWFAAGAGVLIVGFIIGFSVKRQRRRGILM